MRALFVCLLLPAVLATAAAGTNGGTLDQTPQNPPRDIRDPRAQRPTGTAVIRGRVTASDTGMPVQRAVVSLSGGSPRSVYTDHEGRFELTQVAPGTYTLNANGGMTRARYLSGSYGASSPGLRGRTLLVANGQTYDSVDIQLPRAGAISGRVVDGSGEPAARVQVSIMMVRRGSEPSQMGGAATDDLGQFRIFGLQPGEYIVFAEARPGTGGPTPIEGGEAIGFARTYSPGTPNMGDAVRIRLPRGGDASADIRLVETAVFTVSGTVLNAAGEPIRNTSVSLARADSMFGSMFGGGIDQNGVFTIRNVPPGQYDVIARFTPPRPMAMGGPSSPPQPGPPPGMEMGIVRIDVSTANVDNVTIVTSPGETFTGQIVFEDDAPAGRRANIFLSPAERRGGFTMPPGVEVKEDTFTVRGAFGPMLIRGSAMVPGGGGPRMSFEVMGAPGGGTPQNMPLTASLPRWGLKAVLLDGKDITDVPTVFTASNSGRVQVVFSSKLGTIEGTVTDDSGKPTRDATVVIFSQDEEAWRPSSSRLRSTGIPRDDGKFAMSTLREGHYYVLALPADGNFSVQWPDREFLSQLKKLATEVVVQPGETRTVDLRMVKFEQ